MWKDLQMPCGLGKGKTIDWTDWRRRYIVNLGSHKEFHSFFRMITFGRYCFVCLFLSLLFFMVVNSAYILAPNQSLRDNGNPLVSANNYFALGFFSPNHKNSNLRYVGIWYYLSAQTVVWVANRERPLNGTSGVLSFKPDGNIFIYDHAHNITVWQTNVLPAKLRNSSCSAQLLDTGNFVLFEGNDAHLWESFNYPSNTHLSKMKLGFSRKTGFERILTSWKSIGDPTPGEYSLRMDPKGLPQLVLLRGADRLWRTGPWMGSQWSGMPQTNPNYFTSATYVDDGDEVSIMYNFSIWSPFVLDEMGSLHWHHFDEGLGTWIDIKSFPEDPCEQYGRCGSYGICGPSSTGVAPKCTCPPGYEPRSARDSSVQNGTEGCVRKRRPVSECDKGDGFFMLAKARLPDVLQAQNHAKLSPETCQKTCLKNCSCTAYSAGGGVECITWHGDLNDIGVLTEGGHDLHIRVDSIELAPSKKTKSSHRKKEAIVVGSIAGVLLLIICLVCWLVLKRRREARLNMLLASEEHNLELPIFDFATIVRATNNFSIENKIGEGGFGPVYKGYLSTEKEIAVKRLSINSRQGVNEFKNEVILIAKLQHRNLVRLLGCCIHKEERMLVYEYMPNGSLDFFIFGSEDTKHKLLSWRRRLDIIIGIARGLLYLHQDSRLTVIHRDLKTSNILLDSTMNPKISDFGLAKVVGGDQSSVITRRVVGTYGYMSPEYVIDGVFSTKSDVFSFGVIILEILTGQRNRLFRHSHHDLNLLGHAWKLWIEGKALELLDPLGVGSTPVPELLRCIQVGLLCVQKGPEDRLNMPAVLLMLTTETAKVPQPKQPGFYTERKNEENNRDPFCKSSTSINKMSMTGVEAR